MEQQTSSLPEENKPKEELGIPLTIVSFCFPIVGAILYFVHKGKSPEKATTACYAALAGLVVGILIRVATMAAKNQ
jgi:zinc transporter ZupT